MPKLDLYKENAGEYKACKKPEFVKVKAAHYLAAPGQGLPSAPLFQERIAALFTMAYTIKMARKAEGNDYAVCKLEALWWAEGGGCMKDIPLAECNWKLLIRVPDFIRKDDLKKAAQAVAAKGKKVDVSPVVLEGIKEGTCVQMLHVGPYDREAETVAVMNEFAHAAGQEFHGTHHEIYLSDPGRTAPERLRTLLRLPVRHMEK